jgi:hypothetical protein
VENIGLTFNKMKTETYNKLIAPAYKKQKKETEKELELILKYQDEILDIINNADSLTQSDLQGCIEAQLTRLIRELKK